MRQFLRDLLIYPVLILQLVFAGQLTWATDRRQPPGVSPQEIQKSKSEHRQAKAVQGRSGSPDARNSRLDDYQRQKYTNQNRRKTNNEGPRQSKPEIENGGPQWNPNLKMGPLEQSVDKMQEKLATWKQEFSDKVALGQFQELVAKSKQELADQLSEKESQASSWVTKTIYRNGRKIVQRVKSPAKSSQQQAEYYKGNVTFYSEQLNKKIQIEFGSPSVQVLSHPYVQNEIRKNFENSFNRWVDSKGYNHIYTPIQLTEQLVQMYIQAARHVLTSPYVNIQGGPPLQYSEAQFKKEFYPRIKKALVETYAENVRWSSDFLALVKQLKDKGQQWLRSSYDPKAAMGIDAQIKKSFYNSVPMRTLQLWPVETLYFTLAMLAATVIQLSYDYSANPLWLTDQLHHMTDVKGHVGFAAFILANQAFQAVAPGLNAAVKKITTIDTLPMHLRGYIGMGLGSTASHIVGDVLNHPAFNAWWAAKSMAYFNDTEMIDPELDQIAQNAQNVLMYELSSGKFWQKQIGQVTALLGASYAAAKMTQVGAKVWNPKRTYENRLAILKANEDLGKNASKVRKAQLMAKVDMALTTGARGIATDIKWFGYRLLASNVASRIFHFTLFLVADPFVRPMVTPLDKHLSATEAQNKILEIQKLEKKDRQWLSRPVILNRSTLDLDSGGGFWSFVDFSRPKKIYNLFRDYSDAKFQYRYKQLENFSMQYGRWEEFINSFDTNFALTKSMYADFESEINKAVDRQTSYPQLPLIAPQLTTLFNFPSFYSLPEDTKRLFTSVFINDRDLSTAEGTRKAAFESLDLINWTLKFGIANTKGLKNQSSYKALFTRSKKSAKNVEAYVYFRNGLAERMLWNMAFGPSVDSGKVLHSFGGTQTKLDFPRITVDSLPFDPLSEEYLILDDDLAEVESFDEQILGPRDVQAGGIRVFYPLTSIKWRVPIGSSHKVSHKDQPAQQEFKEMNIIEVILHFKRPELSLARSTEEAEFGNVFAPLDDPTADIPESTGNDKISLREFLDLKVYCGRDANEIDYQDPNWEKLCRSGSVIDYHRDYKLAYDNLIRTQLGPIFEKDTHQAASIFSQMLLLADRLSRIATGGPLTNGGLSIVDALGWTLRGDNAENSWVGPIGRDSSEQIARGDLAELNAGAENPVFSVIEDFIAGTGFLKFLLPEASDYNEPEQKALADRAKIIMSPERKVRYLQALNDSYKLMSVHLIDFLTSEDASRAGYHQVEIRKNIEQMQEVYNETLCYIHGRNPSFLEIPTRYASSEEIRQFEQAEGLVEIGVDRFYKSYDRSKDLHSFTKIGTNDMCDIDQIQEKVEVSNGLPPEKDGLDESLSHVNLDHWIRNLEREGKEPLSPQQATREAIREMFDITDDKKGTLEEYSVLYDLLMIDSSYDSQSQQKVGSILLDLQQEQQSLRMAKNPLHNSFLLADGAADSSIYESAAWNESFTSVDYKNQELRKNLAEALDIPLAKVRLKDNHVLKPQVSLRTAIASRSIRMLKDAMELEASAYLDYTLKLQSTAAQYFDRLAVQLCEVREQMATAYEIDTGASLPIAHSGSLCLNKDYAVNKEALAKYWEHKMEALNDLMSSSMSPEVLAELKRTQPPVYWAERIEAQKKKDQEHDEEAFNNFNAFWWKWYPAYKNLFN